MSQASQANDESRQAPPLGRDTYYATNHEGVTYYTTQGQFRPNSVSCTIPAGVKPVGR